MTWKKKMRIRKDINNRGEKEEATAKERDMFSFFKATIQSQGKNTRDDKKIEEKNRTFFSFHASTLGLENFLKKAKHEGIYIDTWKNTDDTALCWKLRFFVKKILIFLSSEIDFFKNQKTKQ